MSYFSRPGPRFVVEAVLIVLTAVVSGLLHLGWFEIAASVFFVWLIAAIVEYSLSHRRSDARQAAAPEELPEPEPVSPVGETVRVIVRRPEPSSVDVPVLVDEPQHVPELEPEPEPELEPEPEPDPEPEHDAPRNWNVWEIESALRESGDANEEREFLLLYLRDYAGPDGVLPLEFDDLVRESFGELLGTPAG